jgi:hypothetical protein
VTYTITVYAPDYHKDIQRTYSNINEARRAAMRHAKGDLGVIIAVKQDDVTIGFVSFTTRGIYVWEAAFRDTMPRNATREEFRYLRTDGSIGGRLNDDGTPVRR